MRLDLGWHAQTVDGDSGPTTCRAWNFTLYPFSTTYHSISFFYDLPLVLAPNPPINVTLLKIFWGTTFGGPYPNVQVFPQTGLLTIDGLTATTTYYLRGIEIQDNGCQSNQAAQISMTTDAPPPPQPRPPPQGPVLDESGQPILDESGHPLMPE